MNMNRYVTGAVLLAASVSSSCSGEDTDGSERPGTSVESILTDLSSCEERIDETDPNETPYLNCPGVAGYSLLVRNVGSGRKSVEILTPAGDVAPLAYQEVVTRHMSELGEEAEWRVSAQNGEEMPIALIVPVLSHEDEGDPALVTDSYLAVAKITPGEICVTDRIPADSLSAQAVREEADSARGRECLEPRPPLSGGGAGDPDTI